MVTWLHLSAILSFMKFVVTVPDLGVNDTVIWSLQLSELHIPYDASVAEGRWENIKKASFF